MRRDEDLALGWDSLTNLKIALGLYVAAENGDCWEYFNQAIERRTRPLILFWGEGHFGHEMNEGGR